MKILLVGNHTCGNRGDGAILRGLIDSLNLARTDLEIDVISRYPTSSGYLLQQEIMPDELFLETKKGKNKFMDKVKRRLMPKIMMAHISGSGLFKSMAVPKYLQDFTNKLKQYDAIIQVGGSFFVDLYGPLQFEHSLCALLAKKPIYMIGHSVGPFQKERFNEIANFVFSRVNSLVLRESVSLDMMKQGSITTEKVVKGADTAFLVRAREVEEPSHNLLHWQQLISSTKTIAITVRELAPFDKRLGVTQQEYEMAFGKVINAMIDKGYQVVALSTCTGIDSYNKDDRMVAMTLRDHVVQKDKYHVIMDEFNDLELGILLGRSHLTIGTRLHSAIISMNFGTPAVAINYEHKSLGVMNQLGLPEMATDVKSLMDGSIITKVNGILDNYDVVKQQVDSAVEQERVLGNKITEDVVKILG
ncbi:MULTISPECIES: colanic acid biosynthesis pyruvyl transferase WcaK [Erwiniaceae]|jgi:colanic acid/amylovoran biosynthesis protein|uniref:Exopolysaccharide biosynthesis protein (Similar to amsJ) n=1 Tax=Erwinia billingiae (strain Eb661) TaxID=634500 RepID=D8MUF7_ERWBE|nr:MULTISPECIES: colanic acid biosynthesis pyruvyl transferase WcaK [Erwinia]MBN7123130.1 colanic acid biosynthesis pyruvyl transferase WcaK [Erwinia billingiae]MCX0500965.1 colanic acid biosynthesis pyruvyl transferase WcaK [Erwinia billingiae]QBR52440.1 colanic acid biosynthesis pyruvyl transferase WcaK [Erwinia sp. QL-Z3]CAX60464.1 Exopolysaccharide biosynthesis protein (similar to amsJ) [Erwinia billingiae Eb661]